MVEPSQWQTCPRRWLSESKHVILKGKVTLVTANQQKGHIITGGCLHIPQPALTHTPISTRKQNSQKTQIIERACQTLWVYQPEFFRHELYGNRSSFFMQALLLKSKFVRVWYFTQLRNTKLLDEKNVWTSSFLWCCLLSGREKLSFTHIQIFAFTWGNYSLFNKRKKN